MPSRRLVVHAAMLGLLAVSALPAAVGPRILHPSAAVKPVLPSPTPSPSATPPPVEAAAGPPAPLSLDMAVGQMMAASFGGPVITASAPASIPAWKLRAWVASHWLRLSPSVGIAA